MTHTASHIVISAMEYKVPMTPIKVRDIIGAVIGGGLVFFLL